MKSLSERFSNRTIKFIFTILFLFAFAVSLWNGINVVFLNANSNDECAWRPIPERPGVYLITDVVPGGVTDKAGIKNGDILLKLNGDDFKDNNPNRIINAVPKGEFCTYLVERDGKQFETKVEVLKVINIVYISGFLFGLGFLIVGFIVVMSKPQGMVQRQFAYFAFLAMMICGLSSLQFAENTSAAVMLIMNGFMLISRILGPVAFLAFFMNFPVRKEFKYKKTLYWFAALMNLLALVYLGFYRTPRGDTPNIRDFINQIIDNLPLFFLIAGVLIFTHSYFKVVDKRRKKSLSPILYGSVIGLGANLYTTYTNFVNPFTIYVNPMAFLPALALFFVPVGYGYSIFRYKLMDTEILIKKSLMYAIITPMIAAIYVLLVFGTGSIIGEFFGHKQNQTLSLLALVVIAFVFDPLKRRIQDWVDKIFYLERQNYQKVLLEFSRRLPLQIDLKQILNSVVTTLAGTMHIKKVGVVLLDKEHGNMFVGKDISDSILDLANKTNFYNYLSEQKEAILTANITDEWYENNEIAAQVRKIIDETGVELVIPIQFQDKLMGAINTGAKLSEKNYSQDDINLLMTVANQTAVAIENSLLYEKEKALSRVTEELKLAQDIQQRWLPKNPEELPGFDIAGKNIPAQLVGGDYYDFIPIEHGLMSICIGDVSGKGLTAAMLMANLHAIVRSQTVSNPTPSECVRQTNRLIFESSNDEMFITLFYGLLNIKEKSFAYTNGGHNLPLYLPFDKPLKRLDTEGLVIGVDKNAAYKMNKILFSRGDVLVLYTDGITEAFNEDEKLYGEDRLIEVVEKNRTLNSQTIIEKILADVKTYSGTAPVHDDMTIVVVKAM